MIKKLIIVASAITALNANAFFKKDNTTLIGDFALQGKTIDSNTNTARILRTSFLLDAEYKFNPELFFNFKGGANLENGTYDRNYLNADSPQPTNSLTLKYSNLDWRPYSFLNIQAGAVNQDDLESPLLVGSSAFLSVVEKIPLGNERVGLTIFAEQAYANNKDLTSTLPNVDEGLPKFYLEGARFHYKTKSFKFFAQGMHWSFEQLAAGIATESAFRGNTPIGGIDETSGFTGFKYKFRGWHGKLGIESPFFFDTKLYLTGEYLENDEAANGHNTGYLGELGLKVVAYGKIIKVSGYYGEIESDASVAYYSKIENNRKTYKARIEMRDTTSPFKVEASFVRLDELTGNLYQSPENRVYFGLSSKYKFF